MRIATFEDMVSVAREVGPVRIAVAGAHDADSAETRYLSLAMAVVLASMRGTQAGA